MVSRSAVVAVEKSIALKTGLDGRDEKMKIVQNGCSQFRKGISDARMVGLR